MGHVTSKGYVNLQRRLDKSVQGAPESDALYKILEILFTEKEAELVSVLPLRFFTAKDAAKLWKKGFKESKKILDGLADKGILLDLMDKDEHAYVLAPTMAGFFEFSLMRTDGRFDRKVLSELFYQYINVEGDFMGMLVDLDPSIARVFVHEDMIKPESVILDYEKASEVIEKASCITVGTCYCRHKMEHKGKACDMPQDVCLSFNTAAKSLSKHGIAKKISKKKAKEILDKCVSLGLVQIGDNVQDEVGWICNCCGCCCEALLGYKKLGNPGSLRSSFVSKINDKCIGCGVCVQKCPVDAISFVEVKGKKAAKGNKVAIVDKSRCIGCGVCKRFCPSEAIEISRTKTAFVPKDSFERIVLSAIKAGKLQNYIFENSNLWTHQLLKKFIQVLLALPPAQWIAANRQIQSRFMRNLAKARIHKHVDAYDEKYEDYSHDELKK